MIKQQIFPTLFPVKGFFYVSLLLGILKEITGSSLTWKTDSEDEVAMVFDMVQKVFQQMLECMARSFKKQPEEGLQVWAPPPAGSELEGQRSAGGPGRGARPAGPRARGCCWRCGEVPCSRRRLPSAPFHWCCPLSLGQRALGRRLGGQEPTFECWSGDRVGSLGQQAIGPRALLLGRTEAESYLQ